MSATIILIITSSSTRNTEPPSGRVAVMLMSLPVPSPRIANNAKRRNINMNEHPPRGGVLRRGGGSGWINDPDLQRRDKRRVPQREHQFRGEIFPQGR